MHSSSPHTSSQLHSQTITSLYSRTCTVNLPPTDNEPAPWVFTLVHTLFIPDITVPEVPQETWWSSEKMVLHVYQAFHSNPQHKYLEKVCTRSMPSHQLHAISQENNNMQHSGFNTVHKPEPHVYSLVHRFLGDIEPTHTHTCTWFHGYWERRKIQAYAKIQHCAKPPVYPSQEELQYGAQTWTTLSGGTKRLAT